MASLVLTDSSQLNSDNQHLGVVSMVVPVYIAESALPEDRGRLVTINNIFITAGQFVASVVCGLFSNVPDGWREGGGFGADSWPISTFDLASVFDPMWKESVICETGWYEQARNVLCTIRGEGVCIEEELDQIKSTCMMQESEVMNYESSGSKHSVFMQVFNTSYTRRALFLGCFLQSIQQLSGINTVMYVLLSSLRARAAKIARSRESSVHAELRRQEQVELQAALRADETAFQSQERLEDQATRQASMRAAEKTLQIQLRLEEQAKRQRALRSTETLLQMQIRLVVHAERQAALRATETPHQTQHRLNEQTERQEL
uniref:(California timema) hypothetical protein n=1 Tax=Timema californicum TaxID=61474 RepID=A0A7R9P3U0_TIMCA|nr:unnamed protein product [Timema californicum]